MTIHSTSVNGIVFLLSKCHLLKYILIVDLSNIGNSLAYLEDIIILIRWFMDEIQ